MRVDIHERYRHLLRRPDLTNSQVEAIRRRVAEIARAICEHVWGKKFY